MQIRLLSHPGLEQTVLIRHGKKAILVEGCAPPECRLISEKELPLRKGLLPANVDLLVISHSYSPTKKPITNLLVDRRLCCRFCLVAEMPIIVSFPYDYYWSANKAEAIRANKQLVFAPDMSGDDETNVDVACEKVVKGINNHMQIIQSLFNAGTTIIRYRPRVVYWRKFLNEKFPEFGFIFR